MSDPYEEFREYARQARTKAGHSISTPEQTAARTARETEAKQTEEQYQGMGAARRGWAGARSIVGGIPIVRSIPGISGFANPPAGTQEATDLEVARRARPTLSGVERFTGGAAGYGLPAGLLPRIYGTLGGAMAGNAAVGGLDAKLAGENPVLAAGRDALSTIPGWAIGRLMTPRGRAASEATRSAFRNRQSAAIDAAIDETADIGNQAWARILQTHAGPNRPPGSSSTPHVDVADDLTSLQARLAELERQLSSTQTPTMAVPQIGDQAADKITKSVQDATQSAMLGLLAAGAGQHVGVNPLLAGAAGVAAPRLARAATDTVNRTINRFNQSMLSENAPRLPRRLLFKYINNQLTSDEARAMLHALSPPAVQEGGETAGRTVAPHLVDMLAGPLSGRRPPTLGGN